MEILYPNTKTQKLFCDDKKLRAEFGQLAKTVMARLTQLESAETLAAMHKDFPGLRIHEYKGKDKGKISIDLSGNYRLIFTPKNPPQKPDGGLDWNQITAIVILEVTDPH